MSVRIVRLGTPRAANEGLRIGTVRRPPRGVRKSDYARLDWYDVWLPELSPSTATVALGRSAASPRAVAAFRRRYAAEMRAPVAAHMLDVLAALSHATHFAVGCYCEDESRCHRSVLRELLAARGAHVAEKV